MSPSIVEQTGRKRELRNGFDQAVLVTLAPAALFVLEQSQTPPDRLLQALVAFSGDGAVVDEYIRSIFAPRKPYPWRC